MYWQQNNRRNLEQFLCWTPVQLVITWKPTWVHVKVCNPWWDRRGTTILTLIRARTGSQWCSTNTGVMWSRRRVPVATCASVFCTSCSLYKSFSDTIAPVRRCSSWAWDSHSSMQPCSQCRLTSKTEQRNAEFGNNRPCSRHDDCRKVRRGFQCCSTNCWASQPS